MPGRLGTMVICILFLVTVVWQISRTLTEPYHTPPRMLDSLRAAAEDGETDWIIRFNGQVLGHSTHSVREDKRVGFIVKQTMTLDGELEQFLNLKQLSKWLKIPIPPRLAFTMSMDMDVSQFGSLNRVTFNASIHLDKIQQDNFIRLFVQGRTVENELAFSGHVSVDQVKWPIPSQLRVKNDSKAPFMSSLAPADCLPRLLPGQQWESPMIDIQQLMMAPAQSLTEGTSMNVMDRKATKVKVREEVQMLTWNREAVPCLLVESKQRGLIVSLWVRQTDGRVLKQVAKWGDATIELERQKPTP